MTITIEFWDRLRETKRTESGMLYECQDSTLVETEEVFIENDEDLVALFQIFDSRNNKLRYCNGCYWKFTDDTLDAKYRTWYKNLDENTKFDMFYGNGIVD